MYGHTGRAGVDAHLRQRGALNVSVFGMGYVGCVTAACLAKAGHRIIGVEIQREKVDILNAGSAPLMEPGLSDLIAEQVQLGALTATNDAATAVQKTDISLICVGTPSLSSGQLDPSAVHDVCRQIGGCLK